MNDNKQNGKKVLDVSRPKKRTADGMPSAPHLVIPKRSVIPADEEVQSPGAEPIKVRREAGGVQPVTGPSPKETNPKPEPAPAATEPSGLAAGPGAAPDETAPDAAVAPATDTSENASAAKNAKNNPHVRKALENAKREQEIQGYIANREFFIPINAMARKRSLKVSIALTLLELLLGLLLLNLMLDAGIIQLLERIPHTNFFNLQ